MNTRLVLKFELKSNRIKSKLIFNFCHLFNRRYGTYVKGTGSVMTTDKSEVEVRLLSHYFFILSAYPIF